MHQPREKIPRREKHSAHPPQTLLHIISTDNIQFGLCFLVLNISAGAETEAVILPSVVESFNKLAIQACLFFLPPSSNIWREMTL